MNSSKKYGNKLKSSDYRHRGFEKKRRTSWKAHLVFLIIDLVALMSTSMVIIFANTQVWSDITSGSHYGAFVGAIIVAFFLYYGIIWLCGLPFVRYYSKSKEDRERSKF